MTAVAEEKPDNEPKLIQIIPEKMSKQERKVAEIDNLFAGTQSLQVTVRESWAPDNILPQKSSELRDAPFPRRIKMNNSYSSATLQPIVSQSNSLVPSPINNPQ